MRSQAKFTQRDLPFRFRNERVAPIVQASLLGDHTPIEPTSGGPASSTLPLAPGGKGAGGVRGVPPSVLHLKTSGNLPFDDAGDKDQFQAKWIEWAEEQAGLHEYRDIFCTQCGENKSVPIYCKNRFCPVCSRSRRMKVQERLKWLIEHTKINRSRRLKMLTLTQPNSGDCEAGVKRIVSAFKRLRQEPFWKRANNAGAWVVEVTGKPEAWHVHIHAILVGNWMEVAAIKAAWIRLAKASIVHIMEIPVNKAIGYVTKYVSKGEFNPEYILQVAHALKSVRMFNVFGTWHKTNAPKVKLECKCPTCQGTKWQPECILYPMRESDIYAYKAMLREQWMSASGTKGNQLAPPR